MAKMRKEHSIVSAISAITAALRLESIPNPTSDQLRQIHDAKVMAANVVDASNFVAIGENADEAIEAAIQAEEAREAEAEAEAEAEEEAEIRAENDETIEDLITEEEEDGF